MYPRIDGVAYGGGIFGEATATGEVTNSIIYDNLVEEIFGGGITVSYSNVKGGWSGEGNIDVDPKFVDMSGNDFHLQADSACVDAGTNTPAGGLPGMDYDGTVRLWDGDLDGIATVDIGAYELINANMGLVYIVDDDAAGDPGPGNSLVSDPLEDGSVVHPFDTIQEGIDAAADWDVVLVLDGTYRGEGNRDIDFRGKSITVMSANSPANCIIDSEGTKNDQHRGFLFHSGEGPDSVLEGFTITGGRQGYRYDTNGDLILEFGGGIAMTGSSPTIKDCILHGNRVIGIEGVPDYNTWDATPGSPAGGGAIFGTYGSGPVISNCTIFNNSVIGGAGWSEYDSCNPGRGGDGFGGGLHF
ncbi:MAG: hypothetical protein GY869_17760, partial [Planctomycetes bacterium]|nr:hypothetical protein [Planctomycetota bacterium]